ncbi:MAG: heavy-metal-associated domain-containing protein [Microthrixaceae bacterium]|nr:heavy-metal-associated domain-containing protein [Microthrixaceae bacterium]MCO5313245.1 heavy-metal-associated domain-containing protein [Microthrixaceae bacterium]
MTATTYTVDGMTCGHCEAAVRQEVEALDGVTVLQVSAADKVLVVESDEVLDDAAVIAAVDEAGYRAARV